MTVAAFMDLALYHHDVGYYARAAQRSGRAGDFFTSVDVGPLFGALLGEQFAEMFEAIEARSPRLETRDAGQPRPDLETSDLESATSGPGFDLVEAGAGNGRLSADVLRAARDRYPELYDAIRLHLVEASPSARAAQHDVLGEVADRLISSRDELPDSFDGVLFANELLDAMPVHQVVMRADGLREVYVDSDSVALQTIEREPSTPDLQAYLAAAGVQLEVGARAEIGLTARDWMRSAAKRLDRGFIVLIDYGHEAQQLYSPSHSTGTLTTFTRHTMAGAEASTPAWLQNPGQQDITAHVDFTTIRAAAEAEGCDTIGFLDQTYFLMGILDGCQRPSAPASQSKASLDLTDPRVGRAFKTLIMPGGLGSTLKVLILGKNVGMPALRGCSFRVRVT